MRVSLGVATNIDIKEINLPTSLTHAYIRAFSDLHLGDVNFNEKKFLEDRKWVEDTPNCYVTINGDLLDMGIKGSKGEDSEKVFKTQNEALMKAVELFKPIEDRILCVLTGNHECRLNRQGNFDITRDFCDHLNLNPAFGGYLGDEAFLMIKLGKGVNGKPIIYTLYQIHGHGSGRSIAGKLKYVEDLALITLADIYIVSHNHTQGGFPDEYPVCDLRTKKMNYMQRTFVSSGAYMQRNKGYAVRAAYKHVKLGSPVIRIEGTHKDCTVNI